MTPAASPRPPRLASWLLRYVLPPSETADSLRGDLLEEFAQRGDSSSSRRWYWRETLAAILRLGWRRHRMPRPRLFLHALGADFQHAIRVYRRTLSFTLGLVTTVALAIAASTAIFAMVNAILVRPLPFHDADRLVWIGELTAQGDTTSVSWPDFADWRLQAHVYEGLAASRASQMTITGIEQATRIPGRRVTANFFDVLGIQPAAGRGFAPDDDRAGAMPVAIIAETLRRRLGDDRAAIGRTLDLDGRTFTVIGILPSGFNYLDECDVFVANGAFVSDSSMQERFNHSGYYALGRLRAGVTVEAAAREIAGIESTITRDHPEAGGVRATLRPLASRLVGDIRQPLLVLLCAVGFMLIIAGVNITSLQVARNAVRRREFAIRQALGAGTARLLRQLLIEALLLAVVGGVAGVGCAAWLLRALFAMAPAETPRIHEVALDVTALEFALATTAVLVGLFGFIPSARTATVRQLAAVVRDSRRGTTSASPRVRRTLIAAEVAIALMLLAGAGLMARTMEDFAAVSPGFRSDHLLTLRLALPHTSDVEADRRTALVEELLEQIRAVPGVVNAAVASSLPITGSTWNNVFTAEGVPTPASHADFPRTALTPVSARYFETMGIPVVQGRAIDTADSALSAQVVVVNETLARRAWPRENALGRRIKWGWPESPGIWRTVVGVTPDVKLEGLADPTPPQIYLPFAQVPDGDVALVLRTAVEPDSLVPSVQHLIGDMNRDVVVYSVRTMDRILNDSIARERMSLLVLSVFAMAAVLLAVIGLYGVTARLVEDRTHEIGVCVALGATRRHILIGILREGVTMIGIGLIAGLAGAWLLAGLLQGLLFGVGPTDPLTLSLVSFALAGIALLACYVPARRSMRIDPVSALRGD